jgi:molybdopterin molybdotransferase
VALDKGEVVPIATSGASILSSTVRADGFVLVPRDREGMPDGADVEVLLYDEDGAS